MANINLLSPKVLTMTQLNNHYGITDFGNVGTDDQIRKFVALYPELNIESISYKPNNTYFVIRCNLVDFDYVQIDGLKECIDCNHGSLFIDFPRSPWTKQKVSFYKLIEQLPLLQDSTYQSCFIGLDQDKNLVSITNSNQFPILVETLVIANREFYSNYVVLQRTTLMVNEGKITKVSKLIEVQKT
jgi:hypothetical protein